MSSIILTSNRIRNGLCIVQQSSANKSSCVSKAKVSVRILWLWMRVLTKMIMLSFSCRVNNQFEVTEELLSVKTMQGRTTAKDVFEQLCDAMEHAGLSLKLLLGIIHLFYKIK